jgi:hypothetical protein
LTERSYDGVVGNEVESFAFCIGRGVDVNYMNLGGANARRRYHIALKVTVDIPREHAKQGKYFTLQLGLLDGSFQ